MIELVPNVSEGRRRSTIDALASTLADTAGVALLDVSSDPWHNRTVLTAVGPSDAVVSAAVALVGRAIDLIDLRRHRGVHPRIGAVDVVPFVPLAGSSMADAVTAATCAGQRIAERFDIPVFLYGHAARSPERRRLENIRRGQFEGLAVKIASPDWAPDFGRARPHPTAGAVAVGARDLLVAFNVNLRSDRLDVARAIAAAVRERSGGLPGVKALGLTLEDGAIVQVSMNLTDLTRTTPQQAFDRVEQEAARYGVEILESEIVGLVPRDAVRDTTPERLRVAHVPVLEARLAEAGVSL